MEQKNLSNWLKGIIIGTGICGTLFYLVLILGIMKELVTENPEFSSWYIPWSIFAIGSAIPCYIVLVHGWKIADNIGKDQSFIMENAIRLSKVSKLAAIDAIYFFVGNIVLLFCGKNHPGIVIVSVFICFAGVVVSVGMAVLSHLARKGVKLQEESDWTI